MNTTSTTGDAPTTGTNHGAFEGMTSLTNVTFASNNVTTINNEASKAAQA